MKVGIDISPIVNGQTLHAVRGSGFYIKNLIDSLEKYPNGNEFLFFNGLENIPSEVDLVHYPYFEIFSPSLPKRSNIPVVVTVHDLTPLVFPKYFPSGIRGKLRWLGQKKRLKKVDMVITDSVSSKKDIVNYTGVNPDKVAVVYLAAGEQFKKIKKGSWEKQIRTKFNLPEKFALYVGDATWNKNLPRLLEAFSKSSIPLVMVGKALVRENISNNPWNKDLALVQNLIQKNSNVKSLGFLNDVDLVKIYNMATFLTMPSLYEGFGLPILEAMSCGCPVLASHEGSLKEIANDSALIIDPYSIDSIYDGIEVLSKDSKLRQEFSEKGFKQAKKFSWEKTAQNTNLIYNSVINK